MVCTAEQNKAVTGDYYVFGREIWLMDSNGEQVRPLFERFDLLAAPAMPIVAPRIGEDPVELAGERIPYRLALIPFNSPWSCLGLPAASVPCGFLEGLPVGLVLAGRPGGDATVLRAARAFQRATDWHERRPPGAPR